MSCRVPIPSIRTGGGKGNPYNGRVPCRRVTNPFQVQPGRGGLARGESAVRTAPESDSGRLTPYLLRRADQAAVAGLVLLALASMAGWWVAHGGCRGRLVEIERAEPLRAQFQVDLNQADWPELVQLPGIGEILARRIVQSREREGRFLDHEDLTRVRGIGPKTLDRVRPYLSPMPERGAMAASEASDGDRS